MGLLAIDPGIVTGWAYFSGLGQQRLSSCGVVSADLGPAALDCYFTAINRCIIEKPKCYPKHLQKGDQDNLIALAITCGRFGRQAELGGIKPEYIWPLEWKGQLTKDVSKARTMKALSPYELEIVQAVRVAPSQAHNMWDAIGIALYFLRGQR